MSSPIIIDESVFDELFVPDRLVARENQIRELARALNPVRRGKPAGRTLLIYGPPGAGKSLICRWIVNEYFQGKFVIVNSWSKRTCHAILSDALSQLGFVIHGRESTTDLIKKFERHAGKFIVVLDEADQMKDTRILYNLSRSSAAVILVSNTTSFLLNLDPRISSGMPMTEIEFKQYSSTELEEIVSDRARVAVRAGSLTVSILKLIAGMAGGDARVALQITKLAAQEAESEGRHIIGIEEVKFASKCCRRRRLSYVLSKLSDGERTLYSILRVKSPIDSGKLYLEYCRSLKEPVTDRAYRKQMKKLQSLGLARCLREGRWRKYETVQ